MPLPTSGPNAINAADTLRRIPLLLLLTALLLAQQPAGGPHLLATALPVSMLNSLSNFYPFALFRSSVREEESAPRLSLIVVKEHRKPAVQQQPLTRQNTLRANEMEAPSPVRTTKTKFGTLKLCPPGGRSFFEAFELACPMKKRRKRHVMFGLGSRISVEPPRMRKFHLSSEEIRAQQEQQRQRPEQSEKEAYRPANISEIMRICCVSGCEFSDFFPHCGPFSMW